MYQCVKGWLKSVKEKLKSEIHLAKSLYLRHEQKIIQGSCCFNGNLNSGDYCCSANLDEQRPKSEKRNV